MEDIKIEVTQEDISKGRFGAYMCPVARALYRTTGKLWCVGSKYARYYTNLSQNRSQVHEFLLPKEVGDFIRQFDAGFSPFPITFTLPREHLMLKVIYSPAKSHMPISGASILQGTLFTGTIGPYSGVFLRVYDAIIDLTNPRLTWLQPNDVRVLNYQEVDGILTISPKS